MRLPRDPVLWAVSAAYAAGAVPLFFVYTVLPALLRKAGLGPEWVGLIFLAYLPYAARFIWAPLIDGAKSSKARYRHWILASLLPGLLLPGGLLWCDPVRDFTLILLFCAASTTALITAMTAADGLLVAHLGPEGRIRAAPLQGVGASLGGLVLGGALAFAGDIGWHGTIVLLVVISVACALPVSALGWLDGGISTIVAEAVPSHWGWRSFFARADVRRLILVSAFIHGGVGLLMGYLPVLQVDAGMSIAQIAFLGMVLANLAGLAAATGTGWLIARFGAASATALCGLGTVLAGGALALVLPYTPFGAALVSLGLMGLGYAFFVAFRALVLAACDAGHGAREAALLFSLDSAFSIITAMSAGGLAAAFGLPALFLGAALLALPGVWLLGADFFSKTKTQPTGQT